MGFVIIASGLVHGEGVWTGGGWSFDEERWPAKVFATEAAAKEDLAQRMRGAPLHVHFRIEPAPEPTKEGP